MSEGENKRFDLKHGLEIFDNNKELLQDILLTFLEKIPEDLENLESGFSNGDIEEVERFAHRMKGSAGMVGAMKFMAISKKIEFSTKEGTLDGAGKMVQDLKEEFSLFKTELELFDWEKV